MYHGGIYISRSAEPNILSLSPFTCSELFFIIVFPHPGILVINLIVGTEFQRFVGIRKLQLCSPYKCKVHINDFEKCIDMMCVRMFGNH